MTVKLLFYSHFLFDLIFSVVLFADLSAHPVNGKAANVTIKINTTTIKQPRTRKIHYR